MRGYVDSGAAPVACAFTLCSCCSATSTALTHKRCPRRHMPSLVGCLQIGRLTVHLERL